MKTPSEPPKSRDDGRRRRLESLLGATFVISSQTPPHKILSLPQALLSFSKLYSRLGIRMRMRREEVLSSTIRLQSQSPVVLFHFDR
ncbi:hypothetical protein M5K25_014329 [Dendrobium thyrsiflorum]|uniref:Uncharacterized protein n=1 Tax=Dendrobium thyrsiflorum TaxID=117978 RepID=A0ABD0UWG0_DENTH